MSKKDYILLANCLRETRPSPVNAQGRDAWNRVRDTITDALQKDNPRFNRETFITATLAGFAVTLP